MRWVKRVLHLADGLFDLWQLAFGNAKMVIRRDADERYRRAMAVFSGTASHRFSSGGSRTEVCARLSEPAIQSFHRVADFWKLSPGERVRLLGVSSRHAYRRNMEEPSLVLPIASLERISHLLALWGSLCVIFGDEERACNWLRRPNAAFRGRTALDVMLDERLEGILAVRRYLDEIVLH